MKRPLFRAGVLVILVLAAGVCGCLVRDRFGGPGSPGGGRPRGGVSPRGTAAELRRSRRARPPRRRASRDDPASEDATRTELAARERRSLLQGLLQPVLRIRGPVASGLGVSSTRSRVR